VGIKIFLRTGNFDHLRSKSFIKQRPIKLRRITMKTYLRKIVTFINDEEGASAIEYGLLVGLIALAIIAGATTLGTKIGAMFTTAAASIP